VKSKKYNPVGTISKSYIKIVIRSKICKKCLKIPKG